MGKSKKKPQPLSDSDLVKKYGEGNRDEFDHALVGMVNEPTVKYKAKKATDKKVVK